MVVALCYIGSQSTTNLPRQASSAARQAVERDLRRGADANRNADGSNAAVHIKLAAGFVEQAGYVRRHQPAGRDLRADELERRLASMGVPRQAELDTDWGG